MNNILWIKEYLNCLFEHRLVSVLPLQDKPLQLLLW